MSKRFDFDDFDRQMADALADHYDKDRKMAAEDAALEDEQLWAEHDRVPGEIGAVVALPLLSIEAVDELPPEAA